MHTRAAGALTLALLGVCPPGSGVADAAPHDDVVVRIAQPDALTKGSHGSLRVEVELSDRVAQPLLLTPHVEGQSIEVVRGRLLRSDARDSGASTLVFDLPIRVLGPGTAVVHVRLSAYACAERCQLVEARTQRVLDVSL